MSFNNATPVVMNTVSAVTASRGSNDPDLGARTNVAGNDYVYVYNAGLAIGIGQVCTIQSGSSGYSITGSTVVGIDTAFGVAKNAAIANAEYGWVMTRGFSKVECASGVSGGIQLACGTNGQATDPIGAASTATTGTLFAKTAEVTVACGAAMCYVSCF
jgi:hypothetical protein